MFHRHSRATCACGVSENVGRTLQSDGATYVVTRLSRSLHAVSQLLKV